jgi:hypothetical protein
MTLDGCLSTRFFYGGNHGTEFYEFAFLGINFTQQSIFGSLDFYIDLVSLDFDDGFAFMNLITLLL